MQRIEKIKDILKSNNIAFSEEETGILKLDNVEFEYLEDLLLHIDFTIIYLREKQSNLVSYLVIDKIANEDKIVNLQDQRDLVFDIQFPMNNQDSIDTIWEEGEYGFVNTKA